MKTTPISPAGLRDALHEIARILASIFATFDADDEMVACVERRLTELFHELLNPEPTDSRRAMHPGLGSLLDLLAASA